MGNKKEILETMMTIIYAIIVLGVLIFVHELGHFLVARWCGVHVERFSIGFGPPIFEWTRGETEYCIAAIPFGGYVKMLGEESLDEVNPSDYHRSFQYQSSGRRALIVAAGPLCNFLLALVLFFVVFVFSGIPTLLPEVGSVEPGSPAELAGFKSGDLIIQINERKIAQWDNLSQAIKQWRPGDPPLKIVVDRAGELIVLPVAPEIREVKNIFGEVVKRPIIGITASGRVELRKVSLLDAFVQSFVQMVYITKLFFLTLVKLIQRIVPFKTVGGPILIAQMAKQQAQAGFFPFIHFIALISLNLGILNLLPFPALDGGYLVVFTLEAITRRRFHQKAVEWVQKIGFALLIVLMVAVFYNDLVRLFPSIPDILRGK